MYKMIMKKKYSINKFKYLSNDEFEILSQRLKSNIDHRNSILIQLALATGARAQEILNITKNDLDPIKLTVFIKGLKGSHDRELPLNKYLFDALYARALNDTIFDIGYDRLNDIWAMWTPNKTKTFHCLRHTFAIRLYLRTKDILLVKTALGHASLLNTMVYAEHIYQTHELKRIL